MPTIARPYGVTVSGIASRVQSLRISADSQPSIADVDAIIAEEGAWVAARLRRVGVGPHLEEGSETHHIARGVVYDLVIQRVSPLRGRDASPLADALRRDAKEKLAAIEVGPQGLGDGAEASQNHRVVTSAHRTREIERYNNTRASLARRMATRGTL